MRFLTKVLYRRFPRVGFIADVVLVGAAVTKVVQRRNASPSTAALSQQINPTELLLAGGAIIRLASRLLRRSK